MENLDNEHLAEQEPRNENPESGLPSKLRRIVNLRIAIGVLTFVLLAIWILTSAREIFGIPHNVNLFWSLVVSSAIGLPSFIIAIGLRQSKRWAAWLALVHSATVLACAAGAIVQIFFLSLAPFLPIGLLMVGGLLCTIVLEGKYLLPWIWRWRRARLIFILSTCLSFAIGPAMIAGGIARDGFSIVLFISFLIATSVIIGFAVGRFISLRMLYYNDSTWIRFISAILSAIVAAIMAIAVNVGILFIIVPDLKDGIAVLMVAGFTKFIAGIMGLVFGARDYRQSQEDDGNPRA